MAARLSRTFRIALFADIHANLEALEAVLADAAKQGCTDHICLGDVVGYNANPSECLDKIRELGCPVVKGNHDEDSGGDHSLENMNPVAAEALLWTRKQLSDDQRDWLRKLRMVRQVEDFTIVHSSLDQPQVWNYVTNKFDAMSSFSYQFTNSSMSALSANLVMEIGGPATRFTISPLTLSSSAVLSMIS